MNQVIRPMENTYGVFLSHGLCLRVQARLADSEEDCTIGYRVMPQCSYALGVTILDGVYHWLEKILFYRRIYTWWKPAPSDTKTQGYTSDEGECAPTEDLCGENNDAGFFSCLFSTATAKLDEDDVVVVPKAEFSVIPVLREDRGSAWLFHWNMDKDMLSRAPWFEGTCSNDDDEDYCDSERAQDLLPKETKDRTRPVGFIQWVVSQFHDILRLGAYTLFKTNEAIRSPQGNTTSNYLVLPSYPVLATTMEQCYTDYTWFYRGRKATLFGECSNLIDQSLRALFSSECFLVARCIDACGFMHEMVEREGMRHACRTLKQPATYADTVLSTFFMLSIPSLWNLVSPILASEKANDAIYDLQRFFCLCSPSVFCETVHIVDCLGEQGVFNEERETSSMTHAAKIRTSSKDEKGFYSVLCPAILTLVSSDELDLVSFAYATAGKKKKEEHSSPERSTEIDHQDSLAQRGMCHQDSLAERGMCHQDSLAERGMSHEHEDEGSVEVCGEEPAKWFFFSRIGWTQFLSHCIERVWLRDEDLFHQVVQELFRHCYTGSEFDQKKREARIRHKLKKRKIVHVSTSHQHVSVRKRRIGTTAPYAYKSNAGHKRLSVALSFCGYDLSCRMNALHKAEDLNPFTCILMVLEYANDADARAQLLRFFAGKRVVLPIFQDGLVKSCDEESLDKLLSRRLSNAPVECSVERERKSSGRVYGATRYSVKEYGESTFVPENLPGLGWQYFSGRTVSSFVADTLYLFGRTDTGFL